MNVPPVHRRFPGAAPSSGAGYAPVAPFSPDASGWLEALAPPRALLLIALLLLIAPVILLSAESLFVPLMEAFKSASMPESDAVRTVLPFHFYLKLIVFCVLAFFGFFQLALRIRQSYYQAWSRRFPRPDVLHVDYQPDAQQSMLTTLAWTLYRLVAVLGPPLAMILLTMAVAGVEMVLFNQFADSTPLSLPTMMIAFLFVMMLLSVLTAYAIGRAVWLAITTLFGDVIAMTEPDLSARAIFDRCRRLAFQSPQVYLLYPAYALFVGLFVSQIALLLYAYNMQDILTLKMNLPLVFAMEATLFASYIALCYLKFHTYHDALARYYRELPPSFRDKFTPPPSVRRDAL
ncbi:MAG: hypothetical protein IPK79_01490 [Vampirovibrionales bacterium]|nr:hypothetical protein [Vampirovibrionales bacterium]